MAKSPRNTIILALYAALSLLVAGCGPIRGLDRADARAVSEAAFRAIMAKDHEQLRELVAPSDNFPDGQAWSQGVFIRDLTPSEAIKNQWVQGAISGYTLGELTLEDPQGFRIVAGKIALIHFVLAGKSYVATLPLAHVDDKWLPGFNPGSDFFIRFQES